jgi:hypothetical protein
MWFLIKTAFVKFKISNNFKQNIDKTHSKQPKIHKKIHTNLWILKISGKKSANQKSRDFCKMFAISKQETKLYAMDLKIVVKDIAYPMDFCSLPFPSQHTHTVHVYAA